MVSVEYKYPSSLSLSGSSFRGSGAGNVSLSEGDSVMLRCRADSNPPASVAWRRAGVAGVWSTREEVLIQKVGREEAGIYTCTAHNAEGDGESNHFNLDIRCESPFAMPFLIC